MWVKEQYNLTKFIPKEDQKREWNRRLVLQSKNKSYPIFFDENENNIKNLKKAINLLESFRKGDLKTSQAFDIDQLAKIMALRALLGSSQFDWLDTKFYYNVEKNLLEPISKEIHVDLENNYKIYYPTWWIDSYKPRSDYAMNKDFFIDDLFRD